MDTVLLSAAGKGTRLNSIPELPKPMMEIPIKTTTNEICLETQPIIGYIINQIKKHPRFENLVVALDFGREVIEDYIRQTFNNDFNLIFPDKNEIGEKIYQTILGVRNHLPDNFLMLNADIYSSLDINQLADDHLKNYENGIIYTIATTYLNQGAKKCGIIETLDSNNLRGHYQFLPKGHEKNQGWIDTGFVATSQKFIDTLEKLTSENENFGYHDARLNMFKNGQAGVSIQNKRFWFDIGTPEDYLAAVDYAKQQYFRKK